MDAVEFVKERRRMSHTAGTYFKYTIFDDNACVEDVVKEVEEWSAKHPIKTRQSIFLEQYPETKLDENGIIEICPAMISINCRDINGECKKSANFCSDCCRDCCRDFWMQKVE